MAKRTRRKRERQPSETQENPSGPSFDLEQYEGKPWFLPTLGLCGLLMGILLFDANLSLSGDNAQFINLGRSLADGHGLSETLGDEPVPHTKYPFGFPILLAVVDILFPSSLIALKYFVVLLYAISIPLTYLLIRQFAELPLALGVSLLCLLSPPLLEYSHQVMSEIPFTPVALLALLLLHRAHKSNTHSALAAAIITIMAAYYIRSAGIILVGTGVIFFALHQKWKEAGIIAGGSLLLALPWQLRNSALGGNDYVNQLFSVNPYDKDQGLLTFSTLIERILANLYKYGIDEIPRVFVPTFMPDANWFIGLVFSGFTLYALITGLLRRQLLAVYLACYLGLYILWPQVWSSMRFLIPAIPILFYLVLTSIEELLQLLARALKKTPSRTGVVFFFLLIFGSNLFATNDLYEHLGRFPPNYGNYFKAGEWIRDNTDANVLISCRKPFLMNAVSNRKTTGYVFEEPEAVIADLEKKGVNIVIFDQIGFSSTPRFLWPAIQAYETRFETIHVVRNPDTFVLRFK